MNLGVETRKILLVEFLRPVKSSTCKKLWLSLLEYTQLVILSRVFYHQVKGGSEFTTIRTKLTESAGFLLSRRIIYPYWYL